MRLSFSSPNRLRLSAHYGDPISNFKDKAKRRPVPKTENLELEQGVIRLI
jgi:hypothetical protein